MPPMMKAVLACHSNRNKTTRMPAAKKSSLLFVSIRSCVTQRLHRSSVQKRQNARLTLPASFEIPRPQLQFCSSRVSCSQQIRLRVGDALFSSVPQPWLGALGKKQLGCIAPIGLALILTILGCSQHCHSDSRRCSCQVHGCSNRFLHKFHSVREPPAVPNVTCP